MDDQQIHVVSKVFAKEGSEKVLEDLLRSVVPLTRQEAGCLDYRLHRALDTPGLFYFYETWRSPQDLHAHAAQPYIRESLAKAAELVREPPSVAVLGRVA